MNLPDSGHRKTNKLVKKELEKKLLKYPESIFKEGVNGDFYVDSNSQVSAEMSKLKKFAKHNKLVWKLNYRTYDFELVEFTPDIKKNIQKSNEYGNTRNFTQIRDGNNVLIESIVVSNQPTITIVESFEENGAFFPERVEKKVRGNDITIARYRMLFCDKGLIPYIWDSKYCRWRYDGNDSSNIMKIVSKATLFDFDLRDIFDAWNNLFPGWPVKYELFENYQVPMVFRLLMLFYKNPALSLVLHELGPSMDHLLLNDNIGYHDKRGHSHSINKKEAFNFNATNVRDFLRGIGKGTYKWLRQINATGVEVGMMAYDGNWDLLRRLYGETNNPSFRHLFDYYDHTDPNIAFVEDNTSEKEMVVKFVEYHRKKNASEGSIVDMLHYFVDYCHMCYRNRETPASNLSRDELMERHDEIAAYQRIRASGSQIRRFREIGDRYNALCSMEIGNYIFSFPKTPKELYEEGSRLSHCVAGYFTTMSDSRCIIMFQRLKDSPDVPLLTVELDTRLERVVQHRGKCNRTPRTAEGKALDEYLEALSNEKKAFPIIRSSGHRNVQNNNYYYDQDYY